MTALLTQLVKELKTRPAEEQDAFASEALKRLTSTEPAPGATAPSAPDDLAWVDDLDLDKDENVKMDPRQREVVIAEIKEGLREIEESRRTGRELKSARAFLDEL